MVCCVYCGESISDSKFCCGHCGRVVPQYLDHSVIMNPVKKIIK